MSQNLNENNVEIQNNEKKTKDDEANNTITKKKSLKPLILSLVLVVVVIAGIAFTIMGINLSNGKKVQNLISDGNNYLQSFDYEQALAAFQQAIEIDPKSEDAYIGIADTYLAMADSEIKKEDVTEKSFDIASEYMDVSLEILQNGMQMIQTDALEKKAEEVHAKKNEIQNLKEEYIIVKAEEQKRIEEEKQKEEEEKQKEEEEKKKQEEEKKRLLALDSDLSTASVGDIVNYGHKRGKKGALEWLVLDKNEDEILLFAQEALCVASPEDIYEDLQQYLLPYLFYDEELNNISKRELQFGGKSFLPDTDWRIYNNSEGLVYNNALGVYVKNISKARRKQDAIPDSQSRYTPKEESWFLLTWDDIRKYLYKSDMKIDNVNCNLKCEEFNYEFDIDDTDVLDKMHEGDMWLVGGCINYEAYGSPNTDLVAKAAVASIDSQVQIVVVDDSENVGFRPAMWVSLEEFKKNEGEKQEPEQVEEQEDENAEDITTTSSYNPATGKYIDPDGDEWTKEQVAGFWKEYCICNACGERLEPVVEETTYEELDRIYGSGNWSFTTSEEYAQSNDIDETVPFHCHKCSNCGEIKIFYGDYGYERDEPSHAICYGSCGYEDLKLYFWGAKESSMYYMYEWIESLGLF